MQNFFRRLKEMAKEVQNSRSGEAKKTVEDLDDLLLKWAEYNGLELELQCQQGVNH